MPRTIRVKYWKRFRFALALMFAPTIRVYGFTRSRKSRAYAIFLLPDSNQSTAEIVADAARAAVCYSRKGPLNFLKDLKGASDVPKQD